MLSPLSLLFSSISFSPSHAVFKSPPFPLSLLLSIFPNHLPPCCSLTRPIQALPLRTVSLASYPSPHPHSIWCSNDALWHHVHFCIIPECLSLYLNIRNTFFRGAVGKIERKKTTFRMSKAWSSCLPALLHLDKWPWLSGQIGSSSDRRDLKSACPSIFGQDTERRIAANAVPSVCERVWMAT